MKNGLLRDECEITLLFCVAFLELILHRMDGTQVLTTWKTSVNVT